jgi:uncharacterized protein (TIGR02271 family)
MLSTEQFRTLTGRRLIGQDGQKIGTITHLYADNDNGSPTFVTAVTGLFGTNSTFVPVGDARLQGDNLMVPYSKDQVKDAPNVSPDGELSEEEENRLYAHYGIGVGQARADSDVPDGVTAWAGRAVGSDTSDLSTDSAMTRSEEQLRVGTQKVEAGRARLRKYVVTENVAQTVPVEREEVRVEREPITEANRGAAYDGPAISEEEHEVVLTEERPVVEKEAVPVERVRLDKETVTEQVQVTETVRKEQLDLDGNVNPRTR